MPVDSSGPSSEQSIAKVLSPRSRALAGTAFAIDENHLLTCAHVAALATGMSWGDISEVVDADCLPNDGRVLLEFSAEDSKRHEEAQVKELVMESDVAVLEVKDHTKWSIQPLPLIQCSDWSGLDYFAPGYSADRPKGLLVQGKFPHKTDEGLVAIPVDEIDDAFSGSPVWAHDLDGVIGMATLRGKVEPTEAPTVYVISTSKLMKAWPFLEKTVVLKERSSPEEQQRKTEYPLDEMRTLVDELFSALIAPGPSEEAANEVARMSGEIAVALKDNAEVREIMADFLKDPGSGDVLEQLRDPLIQVLRRNTALREMIEEGIGIIGEPSAEERPSAERSGLADDAVEQRATAEQPISRLEDDLLGFDVYVLALRDFITSRDTTTPLTISIDGRWGEGKSSLMGMLKTKLSEKKYPTVWFNAWKFDDEEKLWAALALALLDQLTEHSSLLKRLWIWIRLTWKRSKTPAFVWQLLQKVLLPLLLAACAVAYSLKFKDHVPSLPESIPQWVKDLFGRGDLLFWLGAIVTGLMQIGKLIKDPFQIPISRVLEKSNYKERIGFIGRFRDDFKFIVRIATKASWLGRGAAKAAWLWSMATKAFWPQRVAAETSLSWSEDKKLVVFIDDLDRCRPPKAADVIEAINLFLDVDGCVFVLGMDSSAVIASIETKYKALFKTMRRDNVMVVSPGRRFLEKIIQVPFHIPRATRESIDGLVRKIIESGATVQDQRKASRGERTTDSSASVPEATTDIEETRSTDSPAKRLESQKRQKKQTTEDVARYAKKDVRDAITYGSKLLPENPRQVKRFINLFRLNTYIANERGILKESASDEYSASISLHILATWVASSIRWPSLMKHLATETDSHDLRGFLMDVAGRLSDNGKWIVPTSKEKPSGRELSLGSINKWRELPQTRKSSHWCHLPWEWWLAEESFCKATKELACLWHKSESKENDLLLQMLSMSELTVR